jgi:predicted house-cleaning noncanonical NTP pyrophosphatase (MazG superfamily)
MKVYNKLVRDKIPSIIEQNGSDYIYITLTDQDYADELDKKLQEELQEYYSSKSIEELADLVEVVYAILKHREVSINDFETIRLNKCQQRGAFNNKYFLISTD